MSNDKFKLWFESPSGRKIVLAVFLVFALGVIIFSFILMNNNFKNPFDSPKTGWQNYIDQKSQEELKKMQATDTDNDGLTDFEEKTVYATSLYVADTDSDGINDGDEIAQGRDPLCAEGSDCGLDLADEIEPSSEIENEAEVLNVDQVREELLGAGISSDILSKINDEDLLEIYKNNVANDFDGKASETHTVAEIKEFMLLMGADPASLVELSDEEIQSAYNETKMATGDDPILLLKEQGLIGASLSETNSELAGEITQQDLAELRLYLIENGLSAEEVRAYSDEELKQIIIQVQQDEAY